MVPRENCINGAPPALIMPVDVDDFLQGGNHQPDIVCISTWRIVDDKFGTWL